MKNYFKYSYLIFSNGILWVCGMGSHKKIKNYKKQK